MQKPEQRTPSCVVTFMQPSYFPGSTSAYNAIVSASVVALGVTYAIPPAINCLRGRKMLPASRPFILPSALGWVCNLVCAGIHS